MSNRAASGAIGSRPSRGSGLFLADLRTGPCGDGGARDAVGVQMVSAVRQLSSLAGSAHGVLRPAEDNSSLGDVERWRPVVEHLWNTNAVDALGPLVNLWRIRCYAARMIWLGS